MLLPQLQSHKWLICMGLGGSSEIGNEKSVVDVVIKSSEAEVEMAEQQERHRALWVV